jgi:hypothetical protein
MGCRSLALASFALASVALVHSGCGAAPPPAAPRVAADPSSSAPPSAAPAEADAADSGQARELPSTCAEGPICLPPPDFAERLCARPYPEAALHLFGPKTPWKRVYLQRSFQAWHVGGHGELRELHRGEEVLVLAAGKTGGGGMQVGGRSFEVFRWDGTCVSLMEDELEFNRPPAAAPANIPLKKLDPDFQAALAEDKRIKALRTNQERLCEGPVAEKEPGKTKCELARRSLSLAIAQAVGRGAPLPPLSVVP